MMLKSRWQDSKTDTSVPGAINSLFMILKNYIKKDLTNGKTTSKKRNSVKRIKNS
jgi:hypothetical protein